MKTKRAYIDCALEAALAAKNHGFKYKRTDNALDPYNYVSITKKWVTMKFYIKEERLRLLDYQVGDLVQCGRLYGKVVNIIENGLLGANICVKQVADYFETSIWYRPHELIIIRRDDLPFPKISYED